MHRLGIDLGGTKIEGIVLDSDGKEIFRHRIETEQEKGYEHILERIYFLHSELLKNSKDKETTFGIGTPGAISKKSGKLKNSNTVCLNGKPFKEDLEAKLGRKIEIQNDANCFAAAEAQYGAGRGHNLVFGVIMGTGCGGGIVHGGKVLEGPQSIAGEWGHMSIDPCGPECYCGNHGCVETFISGGGVEARYEEEFDQALPFAEIMEKARGGDPKTRKFTRLFFENFGRSMANLINVLDPDVVVLGGGVSNVRELYTLGVEQVRHFIFSDSLETPIVKNQLGDSAGVIGAALIGV